MALPLAGDPIYSTNITRMRYIKKSASQTVTASTTKVADADFSFALPVGNFRIETRLTATGPAAGDLSINWAFTGTATLSKHGHGPGPAMTAVTDAETAAMQSIASTSSIAYGTDGSLASAVWEDMLVEVTVAGTLTMQWAQRAASGATVLTGSSRVYITELEAF